MPMQSPGASDFSNAARDAARAHQTLRFAFVVTVAFIACELLQWTPTFLAPILAGVLVVNVPIQPPPKLALTLLVVVATTALIALLLSTVLHPIPLILFGAAALVVFLTLYMLGAGGSQVLALFMLICVTAMPVLALESLAVAGTFARALVRSTVLAIGVVWIAYLFWSRVAPPRPAASATALPPDLRLRSALLGAAILAPLMLAYLAFGLTEGLPVLVATSMIVMTLDFRRGRVQALALVAGNVGGGIAALVLFVLVAVQPSIILLTLITALAALAYGWRISAGDRLAPIVLVACNATLIVFASSIAADQGTLMFWITRLSQFVIAGAFTIGMMTLFWPSKAQSIEPPAAPSNA